MTSPVTKPPPNLVRIFDTTLRDGEQSPGATLTSEEKLEVARALSRLGVDVIEAGFPCASPDDFEAVRQIALSVGREVVTGRPSEQPPIHTFLATSPIHREHKLRMTKEQVVQRTREMVTLARSLCQDVEFSPED